VDRANTIARCEATLASGEQIVYSDWEPGHVKEARFRRILDGRPLGLTVVTTDGSRFTVDLVTGALTAGVDVYTPALPTTPLRLVYYKHMTADAGHPEPVCEYFVVGWQTTVDGRNLRLGLKAYPREGRHEVTADI
jgi:hypothetical protein